MSCACSLLPFCRAPVTNTFWRVFDVYFQISQQGKGLLSILHILQSYSDGARISFFQQWPLTTVECYTFLALKRILVKIFLKQSYNVVVQKVSEEISNKSRCWKIYRKKYKYLNAADFYLSSSFYEANIYLASPVRIVVRSGEGKTEDYMAVLFSAAGWSS